MGERGHVVPEARPTTKAAPTRPLQEHHTEADRRPAARAERERQALANRSPAVQRLARLQQSATRAGAAVLQRRIGFELETGIPVAEELAAGVTYGPLDNEELESPFPGGKLMVDHLPGHTASPLENYPEWNIVEFVTDPIDDRLAEASFRNLAQGWITNLQTLEAYAQANHAPVQNAPNVGAPGSGLAVTIGIPAGGDPAARWGRFAPQATMGIKLKNVGRIMAEETHAGGFAGHVRHDRVAQGAQPAAATARQIMDDIHAAYPKWFHTHREGFQELQGLIVLICNYVLSGAANAGRGGYAKNQTTFMYKTKLSSVRNDIVTQSYPGAMLNDAGRRAAIATFIQNRTGRTAADDVFDGLLLNGAPVTLGPWLAAVLDGTEDEVFMAMKNPWSAEIGPENVGGKKAAIMEMRDTSDFGIGAHGIAGLHDTANILDYLTRIYRQNKQWSKRG